MASDIISSQVDADRLDYLLRDSYFCGVPYGNPDILWIINHITKIKETGKPPRLGFLRKGWPAIEHFLLCRRIMTQNVYYHHKKNVFEHLLIEFLVEVSQNASLHDLIKNDSLKYFLKNAQMYRNNKEDTSTKDDFIKNN